MRKEFKMTDSEREIILEGCKPVPMIMLQCGSPPSQQQNANDVWRALGEKLGFDFMTVQPVSGKSNHYFSAVTMVIPEEIKTMAHSTLKAVKASVATLTMRKQYELTPKQVTEIKDCNFEPKMTIENYNNTPQLRANLVWVRIAKEMGFDLATIEPVYNSSRRIFTAVEVVLKQQ